jgi:hypothetical protein
VRRQPADESRRRSEATVARAALDAPEGSGEADQIARASGASADPTGEALEVPHAGECVAQRTARPDLVDQRLERVEALADPSQVEERTEEPLAQPARPHRRPSLVEQPEQRAATLTAERLHQLQVSPGGGVEREESLQGIRLRRSDVRRSPAVHRVDVGQGAARRAGRQRRQDGLDRCRFGEATARPVPACQRLRALGG